MSDGLGNFKELQLQSEQTMFIFHGYRMAKDGERGHGYFKHAHSLGEALADIRSSPGVLDEGPYLVRDAFLAVEEGQPVIHVEIVSLREAFDQPSDQR